MIKAPNSTVRDRTHRVKPWRDHGMVVRSAAASLVDIWNRFKRIMGYQQCWMPDTKLKELAEDDAVGVKSEMG